MPSLVLFTTGLPSKLTPDLERAGYSVFEALAISEVLYLCETEQIEIVVIDASVDDRRAQVIQQHHVTIRLKPEATASELISELWQLLPDKAVRIQ